MNSLVRANIVAYRRRYAAVIAAITIGVAFLTATLFVSTSIRATLGASVGQAYQNAGLVVEPKLYNVREGTDVKPRQVIDKVAATPGVESHLATGSTMVNVSLNGSQKSAWATVTDGDTALFGPKLVDGTAPGDKQVTLSETAAHDAGLKIGSTLKISVNNDAGAATEHEVTLSGLRQDAQDPSLSGYPGLQLNASTAAALGLHVQSDLVLAKLGAGADAASIASSLEGWMQEIGLNDASAGSPGTMVTARIAELSGGVDVLSWVLMAFAGVALIVTVIVVANTFAVILAQRTRELALLRTLGARRGQIRSMVTGEALVVGALGGVLGVLIAWGVVAGGAAVVRALLSLSYVTFGFSWVPLVVGLVVGILVTLVASARPAMAATRVAPLAALRPAETVTAHTKAGRTRIVVGLLLVIAGAGALVYGVLPRSTTGADFTSSFGMAFIGGLLSFIGVLMLGTLLIPWAVRQLARPFGSKIAGRLAGLNALRHPQRTAAIGTALLLGVTLVSLMLVGASSARSTLNAELGRQYPVDLVLAGNPDKPLNAGSEAKVAQVSGVKNTALLQPVAATTSCVSANDAQSTERASNSEESCALVYSGDQAAVEATLTDGGVTPRTGAVAVGDSVTSSSATEITLTDGKGRTVTVPIDRNAAAPAVSVLMTNETRSQLGLPAQLTAKMDESMVGSVPTAQLWVKAGGTVDIGTFVSQISSAAGSDAAMVNGALPIRQTASQIIDTLLMVVSALLAVAVVIALIGVSNTLSLSVIERTRENSLLRALGLTKKQLRGMLALEAALIAGAAAILGLVLGSIYGLAGARASTSDMGGFSPSMPWLWLAVVLVIAVGAAVLASVWPARRAAKLSPVEGLSVE